MKEVEVNRHLVTLQIWDTAGLLLSSSLISFLFLSVQVCADHCIIL